MDEIKKVINDSIRSIEQRGVQNLNADYPFMMANKTAFKSICDSLIAEAKKLNIDFVAGIEATGFPMAGVLAFSLNQGLIMIRKEGKLPGAVVLSEEFLLPYKNEKIKLEIQKDIELKNKTVLLFDEAIDSGNTLKNAVKLLYKADAKNVIVLTITNYPNLRDIERAKVISLIFGEY